MPQIERPVMCCRRMVRLMAALSWALASGLSLSETGWAQEPTSQDKHPTLMALVDGSGSMWGGLGGEGRSKLAATREALQSVLPQAAPSHRLGLATFGPGCRTSDVLVAPGSGGVESVTAPLVKFNPRGKGPLSAGLKAAADAIDGNAGGAIVLFHDGLDNCGEDQCAAAAQLHDAKPDLKVFTISLGLEAAQVTAIGCIAKLTGARAYTADDPEGVAKALDEIVKLIDTKVPAPLPATAHQTTPTPTPKPTEKGPSRLVASARLIAGGELVTMPLSWRVTSLDGGKILHEAVAPSLTVPLPGGPVHIEVTSGAIAARRDVEIAKEGDSVIDIALDAGIVRFDTGAERLASDAEEPLIYLERLASAQAEGAARTDTRTNARRFAPLWIARGKAIEALLPPGDYRAVAEYGLARAVAQVHLVAGKALNLALPLEAGRLELSTTPHGLDDIVYRIEVDDPDRPGGRRLLAETAYAAPAFVLSTGTYYVTAATAGEDVRRLVTVRSGEITRETFNLALVSLEVEATVNGVPAGREPLSLAIKPLTEGGNGQPAAERLVSMGRPIRLVPGKYRVTLRHGLNDAATSRDIELGSGNSPRLRIDLKTALISLDTSGPDGRPLDAVCEMKSEAGSVIWRTVEIRPDHVVAPGQYALRCRSGTAVRDVAVTAAAGQVTRVAPFAPPSH